MKFTNVMQRKNRISYLLCPYNFSKCVYLVKQGLSQYVFRCRGYKLDLTQVQLRPQPWEHHDNTQYFKCDTGLQGLPGLIQGSNWRYLDAQAKNKNKKFDVKETVTSLNTYIVCAELVKGLWCIKKMVVVEETDNTENVLSEKNKMHTQNHQCIKNLQFQNMRVLRVHEITLSLNAWRL